MKKIKTALISVSDKRNLKPILNSLKKNNIKIISSGGTYKEIKKLKFKCLEVSEFTNSPEILEGRVKTLHPKIHAGILNKRKRKFVSGSFEGRYYRIKPNISSGKKIPSKSAHQIIALMFIPNPENKPYVNHIDGVTTNNAVSNLEWVTQSENMQHARKTGLTNSKTQKTGSDKTKIRVHQLELDGSIINPTSLLN